MIETVYSRRSIVIATLFIGALLAMKVPADEAFRYSGTESGHTPVFETRGPWIMYWSIRSEYAEMASIELRVYDAATGDFLGTVQNDAGGRGGRRLFQKAGRFQVRVVSQALSWDIEISEIDSDRAAELSRASEGRATLEDSASRESRRVPADAFVSWRPEGDSILLLFARDETTGYRVHFDAPCKGLASATALSFVATPGGPERYDSIMLENGTRCYFGRVIPTVFD